ncbi:sensor histidine kinase [Actinophytocola oryzae]|uniref:histidine kinase n=1 Tax=Actinophytocola oryzae TaxID=502181 RepID=A0A4V3FTD3_9PSEU|nr:histidine kinase [Actinophytocola oryzae]TDV50971.1 signal transduction histidine kinase [Actinophytocola oryzae]
MTPIPVPQRWLGALLGVALLLDTAMVVVGEPSYTALSLPGAVVLALCAWFGVRWPGPAAVLGALALTVSSVLMWLGDVGVTSIGLSDITLTELVSGVVLVVLVVWRSQWLVASTSVTALVVACLAAMVIRRMNCDVNSSFCRYYSSIANFFGLTDLLESVLFGFFLLVAAVCVGLYLRRQSRQRIESEMGLLIRKQWPLGAALAIIALIELSDTGLSDMIGYAASLGAGVCAFFGPRYPLRNTYLAAAVLALGALLSVGSGGYHHTFLPVTGIAASMALISYVVRYVPGRQAAWGVVALTAGLMVAVAVHSGASSFENLGIVVLFLLLISIATGWYFRARDRERNQTVKAAVTSAQQGERMALARELHDVVAHHVTGIVVQAQAALLVAGKNPDVALPALTKIEKSGTLALTAMRTLVGSLRDGTAAWTAGDSDVTGQATTDLAADLHSVVENYGGPPVELELNLPSEVPHEMGRSVLRLVQESLTNVGKHAPDASVVHVRVAETANTLHIRVSDDGTKRPVNPAGGSGGYGLVGMRERVELLGGRFQAGPSGYVGWSVEAWLPLREGES